MKTESELINYISNKISIYTDAFHRSPDTILMNKSDYETIKDNELIKSLEVHLNHVPLPIIYKR